MKFRLLNLFIIALASQQLLIAQQPAPKVTASLDERQIPSGLSTILKVTVEGGNPEKIPNKIEAENLKITWLSDRRDQSINNGVRVNRVTILYEVIGETPGEYEVPAVPFQINSQVYRSVPQKIIITERGREQVVTADLPYFATFTTDKDEAYVNEGIHIVCKIYARGAQSLRAPGIPRIDNAEKFVIRPFPNTYQISTEQIQSLPYSTSSFSTMIFGLAKGDFEIGPAVIRAQISRYSGNQNLNPFPEQRTVSSEPVKIKIKPLPTEGKPESFFGAVGKYTLDVQTRDTVVRIGDPIEVDIVIRGSANNIVPPEISRQDGWDTYDAKRMQSSNDEDGTPLNVFEQVIIPRDLHDTLPTVEFSYFDPENERYVTLVSNPIPLKITRDDAAEQTRVFERLGIPKEQLADVLSIRTGDTAVVPQLATIWGRPGFWFVGVLPFLAFLALVGWGIWQGVQNHLERKRSGDELSYEQVKEKLSHERVSRGLFYKLVLEYFYRWRGKNEQLLPDLSSDAKTILEKLSETGHTFLYAGASGESEPVGPNERKAALKALGELNALTETESAD